MNIALSRRVYEENIGIEWEEARVIKPCDSRDGALFNETLEILKWLRKQKYDKQLSK